MTKERKIVTECICPPIPIRNFDWAAYLEGYDGGDPIGRGTTEQEAIDDLKTQLAEREIDDLSDEAIKAMDLYWEPDLEKLRHFLATAYARGAREVRL